MKIKTFCRCS